MLKIYSTGSIFEKHNGYNSFKQLAVKLNILKNDDKSYFEVLDKIIINAMCRWPSLKILEKENARISPPLNIAIYYDDQLRSILPTNSLIRTSCNVNTHAFCSFKMPEDEYGNRLDRRYVFEGSEKNEIQKNPISYKSINIVKNLLKRDDIEHPGSFLKKHFGIEPISLYPSMMLRGLRSTFYLKLDGYDILRCSLDRSTVYDLRKSNFHEYGIKFREIELSIYPRIKNEIKEDIRIIDIIKFLEGKFLEELGGNVTHKIKYQRGMEILK